MKLKANREVRAMNKIQEIEAKALNYALEQFNGTENYYPHLLGIQYTDGIKYLADQAGAYWLIDLIASRQTKTIKQIPFQIWTLKTKDSTGVITMKEDTGEPNRVRQEIEFTDFPLKSIKLYFIDGVLLLPSEY